MKFTTLSTSKYLLILTYKFSGRGYRRLYECVGVSSNVLPQEQFAKFYVQLQEYDPEGKAKFETAYQVNLNFVMVLL